MSDEEVFQVWFDRSDFLKNKQLIRKTVEIMESPGEYIGEDDDELCTRGLEHLTSDRHPIFSERRMRVANEVEFLRQSRVKYDPKDLAKLLQSYTKASVYDARKLGLEDERFALAYLGVPCIKESSDESSTATGPSRRQSFARRRTVDRSRSFGVMSRRKRRASTGEMLREEIVRRLATLGA